MKSFLKTLLMSLLVYTHSNAQQDPLYSNYIMDKMLINPAFSGSSHWAVGTIKHRSNLTGFNDKFSNQTFNFHSPIQAKHIGLGFKVINDKRAVLTNFNAAIDVSYHLNLAGGKFSFGLEAGIYQRKIDYNKLILTKLNDQAIPLNSPSSVVPDLSFGMYYQKKQFYAGFSRYHMTNSKFDRSSFENSNSYIHAHSYLIIGNIFDLSKNWAIEPSLLLKHQAKGNTQLDLNILACFKDKISAGLQYRTGNALVSILKYNISENLKIAYSYDYTLSQFSNISNGAHEIVISYGIKLPPPPAKKEIHPRYYF